MPTGSTENGLRFPPHDPCEPVEKIIKGPVTEQEKEEIKKMYADGKTVTEISKITGYAKSSIGNWVGIYPKNKGIPLSTSNKEDKPMKSAKEKEPAPSANDTSSENNINQLNDNTKLRICQEALLNIGDRIAECADGDDYILGYVHAVLDVIGLKAGEHND
ncbi:MAG: hypothetical protein ACI4RN_04930 [Oscillospiraceae bacterium]